MNRTTVDSGVLYVVATPIGNLEDISARAQRVLGEVDLICAEDTRVAQRLLRSINVSARLLSLHDHNETQRTSKVIDVLQQGKQVALISDAGTPLISDPGYPLLNEAIGAGIRVVPIPGASAVMAGLSVSGQATDRFAFEGFPPRRRAARCKFFKNLRYEARTLVFFESCHRVAGSLADMRDEFGATRSATVLRELTKRFESIVKSTLAEHAQRLMEDDEPVKGEFVVVVAGYDAQSPSPTADANEGTACGLDPDSSSRYALSMDRVLAPLLAELPLSQAVSLTTAVLDAPKNTVYDRALALKRQQKEQGS